VDKERGMEGRMSSREKRRPAREREPDAQQKNAALAALDRDKVPPERAWRGEGVVSAYHTD
jgi:hypothetical protein